jgi:transposase InsO family protein
MRWVRAELLEQGHRASRKRVARLMRLARIRGISRRRGFVVTTQRDPRQRPAPDLVNRKFVANGPNELWVADMTYVPTWAGFVYLAVVLDVWSRRVIGWSISPSMTADLVLAALNMALAQRRPDGASTTAIRAANPPALRSARAADRWESGHQWDPSAMPMTMRWPRASSPAWSAN